MGIKRKKSGPTPIYSERWQNLATQESRQREAVQEYMSANKSTLIEAHRAVRAFSQKHFKTFGSR